MFGGSGYSPAGEIARAGGGGGGGVDGPLLTELHRALAAANRANNAVVREQAGRWLVDGDPTEGALLVAAQKAGVDAAALATRLPRVHELPFSSARKLMTTIHRDVERGEQIVAFTKGAPDVLLARCSRELVGDDVYPLVDERRREIERHIETLAEQALRTLGIAIRLLPDGESRDEAAVERDLVFVALVGMIDPPREEAKDAVERARRAGVRPVMITGDHPRTAVVIARELGITDNDRVITGVDLARLDDGALDAAIGDVAVYARVDPAHKLRIVQAFQRGGAIIGMTGDGVNDSPALKTADIGIAMGISGTDVSKRAADVVLADDNFATIVAAIEEGRAIFGNIRKFLRYLLSSNIGEVLTMFFGVAFAKTLGLPAERGTIVLPLLATQILWINMITDGAPALALGLDPHDRDVMRRPPRPRDERVVTGRMWAGIVLIGMVMAASTLFVLDASMRGGLIDGRHDMPYGQTMAFTTLVFAQLFNVFNARSDERSAFAMLFSNAWLWGAVALSTVLHLVVIYVPVMQRAFGTVALSATDWLLCLAAASAVLWVSEIAKLVFPKRSGGAAGAR
jgi:Ca2+-transporting ATPase